MSDSRASEGRTNATMRLGRVSTSEAIVQELTAQILDGRLEAGEPLPEVELAQSFGVSRQSLRAALSEIVFRGLVEREPHRSSRVRVITTRDALDVQYMRTVIEGEATRWLVAHPEALAPIEDAVRRLEGLESDAAWAEIVEGDVAFHHACVAAVGSPRLLRSHALLANEMRLIVVPARRYIGPREMARVHRELFEVLRSGDVDVATARFLAHLDFNTDKLLASLPD